MIINYDELQLDALQELGSIGSGTAATALSKLLGREVDLAVPRVLALPLADAIDAVGAPEAMVASVVMGVDGDIEAIVLLLFSERCAATLCELLGVEPRSDLGESALGEVGNILGASAIGAVGTMTGLALEPQPPTVTHDMLGAVVASVIAATAGNFDLALVLDAVLSLAGLACELSFLLLPTEDGVAELLSRLGLER